MQITKADRKAVTGKKRTHFPQNLLLLLWNNAIDDDDAEQSFRLSREKRRKRSIRKEMEKAEPTSNGKRSIIKEKNGCYQMREKSERVPQKRLQLLHSSPRVYESKRVWKEKRTSVFRVPGVCSRFYIICAPLYALMMCSDVDIFSLYNYFI